MFCYKGIKISKHENSYASDLAQCSAYVRSGQQIIKAIQEDILRLNPLLMISDYVSFDDREKNFLAVAQKAVIDQSGPLDVVVKQINEPLSKEVVYEGGFYNVRILDQKEGLPMRQIALDNSGSRRYILRNDSENRILFNNSDDCRVFITTYGVTDLEILTRKGDSGKRFIQEIQSFSEILNASLF